MVKTVSNKPEEKKETKARVNFKVAKEPYEVAVPEGFDFNAFKPLKKKNFKQEHLWYEHKAAEMRFKAEWFESEGERIQKEGTPAERAKKRQIVKLQTKMAELKKQLTEQGIDVEALLAEATK